MVQVQAHEEAAKGMTTLPDPIERDAMNRPLIVDGCCRGTPRAKAMQMDLLYPEERVAMKDPAEALLEDGEWKKSDMFFEYRVQEGDELKRKGNAHFKAGEFSDAAVCYRKGIYYSGFDESQFNFELHDVHREQVCKVIVPLRLNYALCLLKDGYRPLRAPLPAREDRCKEAVEQCNEVLALFKNKEAEMQLQPPDRVKALYRRALARLEAHAHALPIGDLDKAKEDLSEALKAEPSNQEIRRALTNLKGQEKEERARQRKVWGGALQHGLPSLPGELNDGDEVCTVSPSAGSAGRDACLGGGGDVSGSSARAGGGDTAGKEEREKREHAEKVRAELQRELDKLEGASAAPPATGGWGSSIKRWLGFGPR